MLFVAANREWRLSIRNDTGTPYRTANNATAHLDNRYLQQETVDAILNLATATASDRAAIAYHTSTVERLTEELLTVNTNLVTALQMQRAIRSGHRGRVRGRRTGAQAQTGAVAATRSEEQDLEPPIHSCWTCGPGYRHNSAKCPVPSTGHIYTATKRDMQGGAEETR